MIRHIPHAGTIIPAKYNNFIGNPISLRDINALEIFEQGKCIIFPIDRLICDVERFINDPMEAKGMGICYEKNVNLEPLRKVSSAEKEEIIEKYYKPHHAKLKQMVEEELKEFGKCLIIDCHTYRKEPWPYEDASLERPEIDVGFDDTLSEKYANRLINDLKKQYYVETNTPFQGAIKPLEYIDDSRVASIMLEVRQDLNVGDAKETINMTFKRIEAEFYT